MWSCETTGQKDQLIFMIQVLQDESPACQTLVALGTVVVDI